MEKLSCSRWTGLRCCFQSSVGGVVTLQQLRGCWWRKIAFPVISVSYEQVIFRVCVRGINERSGFPILSSFICSQDRISLSLLSSCSFRIPWASFLCFCWNSIESSSCDFACDRLASALTVGSCFPLAVLNVHGFASTSLPQSPHTLHLRGGREELKKSNCRELFNRISATGLRRDTVDRYCNTCLSVAFVTPRAEFVPMCSVLCSSV